MWNDVDAISRYYEKWWENPKDIRNLVFEDLNQYVLQRIPPGKGKKALDIGSGHGKIIHFLLSKGYEVSAIELNKNFVRELKENFPTIKIINGDIRISHLGEKFDIVTCIEVTQNLDKQDLINTLRKLAKATDLLLINISNKNSLHGRWVEIRKFRNSFVFNYTPKEFDHALEDAGFEITHRRGIGLVTPISLLSNFRWKLIPIWLARIINKLDPYATKICHLYYVEAKTRE